ncbi:MAG TPA: dienelactone hydrolase family protein [Nitrososphaeraceae archaeon]
MVMIRLTPPIILSIVIISAIVIPSYVAFVYAEYSNTVTNVSQLGATLNIGNNVSLQNKTVEYYPHSKGYLVYPVQSNDTVDKKLPAVVMIHEWWGLNKNIKDMANLLAKHGFAVLAADLYNGKVANTTQRAMELVQTVRNNQSSSTNNLQSAVKYLSSLPNVDSSKIVSLGWCFGGGQSLQLGLNSKEHPLAATVLYYGTPLVTDKESLSKIKWPLLGIFGNKDQSIPLDEINQFRTSLNQSGVTNQVLIYNGVGHAFANPSGDNYSPKETEDAWEKTIAFLNKYVVGS